MNLPTATRHKTILLAGHTAFAQIPVAPTLRTTLAEGLRRERDRSVKSALPMIQKTSHYLIGWSSGSASTHHFAEPLVKSVLPLLAFGAMVAFLIFNAHRKARPFIVSSVVPDPHPKLKLQLAYFTTERV